MAQRLIDANAMYERFCVRQEGLDAIYDAYDLPDMLAEMPTVDAVPVIHAHWTTKRTMMHDGEWYCSNCDAEPIVFTNTLYCPNCGAKMDGKENDDG